MFNYFKNYENCVPQRSNAATLGGRTHVVDHEVHDGLGHEVPDRLVDDGHVGVHQVADGLHLSLQLGVAVHEGVRAVLFSALTLEGGEEVEGGGGRGRGMV